MDYPNEIFINDKDAWLEWNLLMTEGTYQALLEAPERKSGIEHNWLDEPGTEREDVAGIPSSRQVSIPCFIIGSDLAEATQKYFEFVHYILMAGYFILDVPPLGLQFKLLYQNITNLKKETKTGEIVYTFTLVVNDDFPFFDVKQITPIKTSENGFLVDGENPIVSI